MKTQSGFSARTVVGILFVLAGLLVLLSQMNLFPVEFSRYAFSFPGLMMLIGIISILNSSNKTFGFILLGIGSYFMLGKIYPEFNFNHGIFWPVVIILFGLYLLFFKSGGKSYVRNYSKEKVVEDSDVIDEVAIFGGGEKAHYSENFKGGRITAIFGGCELDLRNCKLAPGDHVIDVVFIFGGGEIHVPKEWRVQSDVVAIFGGFSNKRNKYITAEEEANQQTVYVKGIVLFGGGEIKS